MTSSTAAIRQMATVTSQAMRDRGTDVSCRTAMTTALTPELAVAYVRELSADVRAVVVLDAAGARLAGPEALAEPARAFLAAAEGRPDAAARTGDGLVLAASTPTHAVVVAAGPLSLVGPSALDARTAVEALSGAPGDAAAVAPDPAAAPVALRTAAEAVILATRSAI